MINKNVMDLLIGKQVRIDFYPDNDSSLTLHTEGKLFEYNEKGYIVQDDTINALFNLEHVKDVCFCKDFIEITLGNFNDSKS